MGGRSCRGCGGTVSGKMSWNVRATLLRRRGSNRAVASRDLSRLRTDGVGRRRKGMDLAREDGHDLAEEASCTRATFNGPAICNGYGEVKCGKRRSWVPTVPSG